MLNPAQITQLQSIKTPTGGMGGSASSNQPMDDASFKAWIGNGNNNSAPVTQSAPPSTGINMQYGSLNPTSTGLGNTLKNTAINTGNNIATDIQSNNSLAGDVATNGGTTKPTLGTSIGPAILGGAKTVTDIGGEVANGALKGVGDIISSFIPQNVKDTYGQATQQLISDLNDAYNAPASNPQEQQGKDQVHAVLNSIVQAAQNNPETAKTIGNAVAMVLAPSGIEGGIGTAKKAADIVSSGADMLGTGINSAADAANDAASSLKSKVTPAITEPADTLVPEKGKVTPESARASAWKDIQPKQTPTTKLAYAKQGNTSAQGAFTKGEITPSTADAKLLNDYEQLYQDGTVKDSMTPNEKQSAVQQKAQQLHNQQKDFLASHDKAVRIDSTDIKGKPDGLLAKLDSVAEKSSMPFSKDVSAKGAYDSAIDTFKSFIKSGKSVGTIEGATTLSKLDEALTNFDSEMDKFNAWGKNKTGEMTDTAMARQQAIRDVHAQVRDYISSQLPKNSPWTAIRAQESNMYQISDRLAQRVADTIGSSKVGQTIKNSPIIRVGIGAASSVTGGAIGAASHLIP